jgi:hypothetical protein
MPKAYSAGHPVNLRDSMGRPALLYFTNFLVISRVLYSSVGGTGAASFDCVHSQNIGPNKPRCVFGNGV